MTPNLGLDANSTRSEVGHPDHKERSRGNITGYPGAMLVALVAMLLAVIPIPGQAKPFLMECNYFKMQPAAFVAAAHGLFDAAQKMADQDPGFRAAAQAGGNLTAAAYSANLIGRVSDCNHGPGRKNIELVAGPFPERGHPDLSGKKGLTLIISALPNSHCEALRNSTQGHPAGRRVTARFEPPGSPAEAFGTCRKGNPFLALGNLPQPNTIYIFQPLQPPAPQQTSCWRSNAPPGKLASRFAKVFNACETNPNSAICQSAITRQNAAIAKVSQLKASGQFGPLDVKARAKLLYDVLNPIQNLSVFRDTRDYIYKTNSQNNVDLDFLSSELGKYNQIIAHFRANPPSGQDPKTVAEEVAGVVWAKLGGVKPIPIRIVPAQITSPCGARMVSTATEKYIEFQNCGYNVSGPSFYETIIEEAVHHTQHELAEKFCRGEIAETDVAYTQAWMFFMNNFLSTSGGYTRKQEGRNLPFLRCRLANPYCGQPLEYHAKAVSYYIRDNAFP